MFARFDLLQLVGKTVRGLAPEAGDRSPGPLARGPGGIGKESGRVARFAQSAGKTLEVSLGPAGLGMTTPDQANR